MQESDFSADGESVGGVVRGHDGLDAMCGEPGLQAGEKCIAGCAVEGGEGLVKQQQAGQGREGAGQGYALRLAAGEVRRTAGDQVWCSDEIQHLFDASGSGGAVEAAESVGDVGGDSQVREERGLLGNEGSVAAARFDPEAAGSIGEHSSIERDAAGFDGVKAGKEAEEGAFACAGGAEEDGPLGR